MRRVRGSVAARGVGLRAGAGAARRRRPPGGPPAATWSTGLEVSAATGPGPPELRFAFRLAGRGPDVWRRRRDFWVADWSEAACFRADFVRFLTIRGGGSKAGPGG